MTMDVETAEIVREYGPFEGAEHVAGVTCAGETVWFASGEALHALDPASGRIERTLHVPCDAGTAFDGAHLYQLAGDRIQKLDPHSGTIIAVIPAPSAGDNSGLAWAEGSLWVGQHKGRKIHQLDPETGAILRTLESNRFVTGVTWDAGELWHATWENDESELRRIDAHSGAVEQRLALPKGKHVSGLESNGRDLFYCGSGQTGRVRAIKRPNKRPVTAKR